MVGLTVLVALAWPSPADAQATEVRARAALAWARIGSVEEYRRATRAQLAHLGDHAPLLRRLIGEGRPDVLAALFDPPDWHAALLLTDPMDRMLVIQGRESIVYRADDPAAERRAWVAVRDATGGTDAGDPCRSSPPR